MPKKSNDKLSSTNFIKHSKSKSKQSAKKQKSVKIKPLNPLNKMKTVKILIATAILSTSFYACKKDEMNMKASKANMQSETKNNMDSEEVLNTTSGTIKVVFDKMGTMVIEGNPNLEKLISMYNASSTAINAAREVFQITEKEQLSIIFDRDGYAVASDIPKVLVGSNIDAFIYQFCKVKPSSPMTLEITKNNLTRNYEEFWNALPAGMNESFLSDIKNLQKELPMNYTIQVSFTENQSPSAIYLDGNGDPQPIGNSQANCESTYSNPGWMASFSCWAQNNLGWI